MIGAEESEVGKSASEQVPAHKNRWVGGSYKGEPRSVNVSRPGESLCVIE